jgi:hypothetical protein
MTPIGAQIAFVDDVRLEIEGLEMVLAEEVHAGTIFFDATPENSIFPERPLNSVKLIFLDLFYGGKFEAYSSAQWVTTIIAPNTKYALVIWSKDTDMAKELLSVLEESGYLPAYTESWQKTDFNLEEHDFKPMVLKLLDDISDSKEIVDIIFGEIIDIEEDGLLINCLLGTENPTFQVRKFDMELFQEIDLRVGGFVKICIKTQPGTRVIDVFEESNDLSEKFKIKDYFEHLKGSAFFNED